MSNSDPKPRRSQAERRRTTRRQIIGAAMRCLATHGYAGTTVSRLLEEAGVSRGAYLHHFPSKTDLLRAVAEHMMRQAYATLGQANRAAIDDEDRVSAMLRASWEAVFLNPTHDVFLQLSAGSQSDDTLADVFRPLTAAYVNTLRDAARHYFEGRRDADPGDLILLTQWLFRGMAMDKALAPNGEIFDRFIGLWATILRDWMGARDGADGPPPAASSSRARDDYEL
ncbi:MAG: helix-turn-helix domain-containing protein [Pseudomonadota bacterium]